MERIAGSGERQEAMPVSSRLALARLIFTLNFVDDVDAATAADQAVGAVAGQQRFERVLNFHISHQVF